MPLTNEHIDALVAALLATNSYSIEKAWNLRAPFRAANLCDPKHVVGQSDADIGNRMKEAGYDRGGITYIIAPRLVRLMEAVANDELDGLDDLVASGDKNAFVDRISALEGFGQSTSERAWMLLAG